MGGSVAEDTRLPPPSGALLSRLKFRQLALVLAIEELRTLHRAAERLAISQPNATRLLQEIERALGARLFERLPHGMVPTACGRLVARHARLMLSDLARLRGAVDGLRAGITGTVRIGAVVAALPEVLARAVAALVAEHPTLSLSVTTDTSDALLAGLQAGRLDIVIGRPMEADPPIGLQVEHLCDEELRIVVGPRHPCVARQDIRLADLAAERWILQPSPSPMRRAVETIFALEQLALPPHPVEAASVTATVALLDRTLLVAVLPRSLGEHFARFGLVAELPVPLPRVLAPYALITAAGRGTELAVAHVRDALRTAARAAGSPRDAIS